MRKRMPGLSSLIVATGIILFLSSAQTIHATKLVDVKVVDKDSLQIHLSCIQYWETQGIQPEKF